MYNTETEGVIDCGVFAIANAAAVALCADTETHFLRFEQQKLREHLVHCLQNKLFCQFPAHTLELILTTVHSYFID